MYISYIKLRRKFQPFEHHRLGSSQFEDWTYEEKLSNKMISFAVSKVGGNVNIRLYPRRMVKTVWAWERPGSVYDLRPYAFRAFARKETISIFDDDTETADSLLWLLLHEIAHIWVTRTPKLRRQFRNRPKPKGYLTDDAAHESSPEEQFANMMADQWFHEFSKRHGSFHRLWWRKQVERVYAKNEIL